MLRFVVRRLLLLVPILIGLSILVFVWIRALPGSPADSLLGERTTPELVREYNERFGLDDPVYVQYWRYVKTTAQFDFGVSIATHRYVTDEIRERFPATMELAFAAMLFATFLGIPLGFVAAKRYGGPVDHASLFASRLGWLPSVGRIDVESDVEHPTNFYILDAIITRDWATLKDVIRHLILPAIALGSIPLAIITRITRASVLDVQNEDYVRTARAKGLPPRIVDRRHILRNALLPISTIIGLQVGLLLSGAILTETVFAFPGMGSWLRDAIFNRDYPVLQGGILFLAFVFVIVNLLVDISYAIINPRIRYS